MCALIASIVPCVICLLLQRVTFRFSSFQHIWQYFFTVFTIPASSSHVSSPFCVCILSSCFHPEKYNILLSLFSATIFALLLLLRCWFVLLFLVCLLVHFIFSVFLVLRQRGFLIICVLWLSGSLSCLRRHISLCLRQGVMIFLLRRALLLLLCRRHHHHHHRHPHQRQRSHLIIMHLMHEERCSLHH